MNLSHLTFSSFENLLIRLKNPFIKTDRGFDIPDCCDYLIKYQNNQRYESTSQEELAIIEHWLERKWQESLDYYSLSPIEKVSQKHTQPAFPPGEQHLDVVLSNETVDNELSPFQALLDRKTHRKFQQKPISFKLFSMLLKELQGEIFSGIWNYYIVIFDVQEIPSGIYHYKSNDHGLSLIKQGLFRCDMIKILCGMAASLTASFSIVLSIDLEEAMKRFPYNRALREIYIDSGRLAQKLLLKGMQHYIGGLPSPAMYDSAMCALLEVDPKKCIPIYSVTMGIIPERSLTSGVAT